LSLRHIVLLLIAAIAGGFTGLIILFLFLKYFI
jgi:Na+-translocating ferredoxin:NAD+ oxidoreductase RnfG subunit